MKRFVFLLWIMLALTAWGCSGNGAEALFDTAKLEEMQDNPEHAKQLYQKIVDEHAGTEYAARAKKRLAELAENQNENGRSPTGS